MNKNTFTERFKKRALGIFMGLLKQGYSYRKSYFEMVNILKRSGVEEVPAYRSLMRWSHPARMQKKEEEAQTAAHTEKNEVQKYDPELLKRLLKAYRLRSEKTIDDLVDHLLPGLFEEE